ncbi:methionyl-tRNA formyltransferase [Listeria immobilis]|uniref:Methionyl-tRNA formyltransferase n=1 Tax=Listeria immobilis TaxID=2713502 RepID=A0ABR6SSZ9_9LIST|nr:methionyl-tRNA formyltransferase [Listeria immobilis]MBC1482327.1 methionyl-tRNA formyltransferase [Listeria immobilis]MBC1506547.1 methionyl-tRNA formyltransferase [Listeria immobilis]MBC1508796.1 methionyl-tRNA formyltransferase [Listeria immobilis]MBC1515732.1 methionyl-tRNA formyltransferase [Listeria immobilis]MBC6302165.1 methionyl-tRNA formyltransferase [Listeria immobilis]
MTKIIFMGTPTFSVPVLEQLAKAYDVIAVVTQPDRPVGRKRVLTPPPVKKTALELGIPVYQPEKLRTSSELDELIGLQADLLVTAAYGQILPNALLESPKHGAINVHASLLPEYRGGAPVHYALLDGKTETGVTIMYMVEKLDAGDMISQREIPITDEDNTGTMFDKLSQLGAELLMDTLPDFIAGKITAIAQDPNKVTFARNISREQEKIDWKRSGREIFNQVRGLSPWPVAYTTLEGKPFKIWEATHDETKVDGEVGAILTDKTALKIITGDGTLLVPTVIQPAGKPKMDIHSFMAGAGRNLSKTTRFGE